MRTGLRQCKLPLLCILSVLTFMQPLLAQHNPTAMTTTEEKTILSRNDFLPWLNSLKEPVKAPLGSELVRHHFPATWTVPGYHDPAKAINPDTKSVDSINNLLYQSYQLTTRREFFPDSELQELLFPGRLRSAIHLDTFPRTTPFRAQLLRSGPESRLYSIMATGEVTCTSCDNNRHQTIEIWLSVFRDGIRDLALVAYESGDDVQKRMRYYYFDMQQNLLLKDFTINELSISCDREEKWQLGNNHRFTKVH